MSALESERHALRENLAETLGPETAGKLMEHLPPVSWDKLATKDDLAEVATKYDLAELGNKLATKDELRELADKMATKDDLRELRYKMATKDDLRELSDKMQDGFAAMKTQSAEHLASTTMTMIGHHRTTMLTLVGTAISIIVVLVISSLA